MGEHGRRALYAGLTASLVLGAAECAGRAAGDPPVGPAIVLNDTGERWPAFTTPDARLGWRQQPGISAQDPVWQGWARRWGLEGADADGVQTNARGWRDAPVPARKPAHQRWVLALGDSSVWGSGVPGPDRFTERLEAALGPERLQVWNAAVPGYSTWQARAVLEESADLPLDGLLIYNMISDMGAARGPPDDLWFSSPARQRGTAALLHSALYRWMRFWVFRVRAGQRIDRDPEMRLRVHVAQYRANLAGLADAAAARGLFVVGVVPPDRLDLSTTPPPQLPVGAAARQREEARQAQLAGGPATAAQRSDYRAAMALEFGARGIPVIDGPAAFTAAAAADPARHVRERQLFVDAVHPSAEGHRILAEAIAPALQAALTEPGAATP